MFKKLFTKEKPKEIVAEIMSISGVIGPMIDKSVNQIFMKYSIDLLQKPITYIVPAVWGSAISGELTPVQKQIYGEISPLINNVILHFQFKSSEQAQIFAVAYLVRALLISKLTYMVDAVRHANLPGKKTVQSDNNYMISGLAGMKPIGNA